MQTYKITNTTKNKVVLTDTGDSPEQVFGQYASCLMLAGIIPMSMDAFKWLGGDRWTTENGWEFIVEEVA